MYIHTHILYEITRNGSLACMLQGLNTMYASSCQSLVCPVMLSSQTRFRASYVRKRSRLNSCSLQNAHGHCEPSTPAFAWVFFRMFSAPKIVHACLTAFSSLVCVCVSNQPKGHLELSWNIYSQYDWLHAQFLKNPEMLFLDYRILRSILFLATLQGCYKTGFPFARPSVKYYHDQKHSVLSVQASTFDYYMRMASLNHRYERVWGGAQTRSFVCGFFGVRCKQKEHFGVQHKT